MRAQQSTFYQKVAAFYGSSSKNNDDEAQLAAHRERAFEDCKKGGDGCNYITAEKFAAVLTELFPDRPESLGRIYEGYTSSGSSSSSSSKSDGKTNDSDEGKKQSTEGDELSAEQMDRFSRQIGAYGMAMMKQLLKMDILIVGLQGVGAESAKNIVLAGPKSVTLYDPNPISLRDLGSNFFATHNDVGKERDTTIMEELRQMNDGVQVRTAYAGNEGTPAKPLDAAQKIKLKAKGGDKEVALATFPLPGTGELTEEIVRAHGVVLMTGSYCQDKSFLDKWGSFCHQENIGFVACNTFGGTCGCRWWLPLVVAVALARVLFVLAWHCPTAVAFALTLLVLGLALFSLFCSFFSTTRHWFLFH